MVDWMRTHPELLIPSDEMRAMLRPTQGPGKAISILYPLYKERGSSKKIGYKCPADVRELVSLKNLRDYFPKTKLIVGLRHPVWWFQSFYNYRIRDGLSIPPPLDCRGPCQKENWKVCTHNAYFHLFLAQLGQTPVTTRDEKNLLCHYDVETLQSLPFNLTRLSAPAPHSIFLYDQTQLDGRKAPDIAEAFRQDLSSYLGLATPLPSLQEATQLIYGRERQGNRTNNTDNAGNIIIDICDAQYQILRDELVLIGKDVAEWIVRYFLPLSHHVHVSSPNFFRKSLNAYQTDPCQNKK